MTQLLLTDRSLEVPPFLQRGPDNKLKYPGMAVAAPDPVTATVTENIPRLTPHDIEVIAALTKAQAGLTDEEKETRRLDALARRQEQRAAVDKKREAVLRQKRATFAHFKWSFE